MKDDILAAIRTLEALNDDRSLLASLDHEERQQPGVQPQPGPARFDAAPKHKYQYLPFGAGPRVCVGADFAMMQAQIILATLLQRFRFASSQPAPKPIMMMTVRPEPGVFLEVVPIGA